MKRQIIFIATALLISVQSYAQQHVYSYDNVDMKSMATSSPKAIHEGKRNMPSTTISTRIFTYDAAGNRILMSTPTRNTPSYINGNHSIDDKICLSVTTGMLRVSLLEELPEPYNISIYNIAGQLVADRRNCRGVSQDINLSHLEKGVYIMDLCTGNNHSTKKFTKALDGYRDELKPIFKSTPTQFQTIIFASTDTPNVGDYDGDESETKLTERQQKILNLIKESPTITGRQMSETLSVSQRTIERDLSALQKKGVLKHEGKDNDGVWIIGIYSRKK